MSRHGRKRRPSEAQLAGWCACNPIAGGGVLLVVSMHKLGSEFDDFVTSASNSLLRTAYLLCGDRGHAEDLLQTALLRIARRWSAARVNPYPYALRVIVNLGKDGWRNRGRRWRSCR